MADRHTDFFPECFVDELAPHACSDALSYRMAMLGDAPLLARCLLTATTLGGWEGGLSGSAQGLACHAMRGSYIALLATARPSDGGLQVEQLVAVVDARSEEHTSELQSLMRLSYAVFCLKKKIHI